MGSDWTESATVAETMTTQEVADVAGTTPEHVARLCREGRLKARKVGRTWLVSEESVYSWLRTRRGPGRPKGPTYADRVEGLRQMRLRLDESDESE